MSRYPRPAREARYKCVSCNAPLTRTVEGGYVCVECGDTPIERRSASDAVTDGGGLQGDGGLAVESAVGQGPDTVDPAEMGDVGPLVGPGSEAEPTVSFVFPTMNEAEGVATCIDWAVEAAEQLGVVAEVIVSDSSDDETPRIARQKGAIVVRPDELGYGNAYRYAFQRVRGEYVVMGDADTTYDFSALPRLLEPIERGDADIVMGSRFAGEIEAGAMPALHQYVGNPLLTKFLNVFYGADVSDAHSGFRVLTREALDTLDLDSAGMEFASEMVMDAATKDLVIEEVPITYHDRVGEETLDSFQDGWRHVKFMLTNAPTYLFAAPGVALGAGGALAMGLSALNVAGPITFGAHTMVAGSLALIVGYQAFLLAVASAIATDPVRQPDDRVTAFIESELNLERGVAVGLALTAAGAVYAGYLVVRWATSGFAALPLVTADMVAFTAIILGVETLFNAFHLGMLRSATGRHD
jgi:predicted RNA-binding Zn-ribbon protein involved in translation (DUF1610 family)